MLWRAFLLECLIVRGYVCIWYPCEQIVIEVECIVPCECTLKKCFVMNGHSEKFQRAYMTWAGSRDKSGHQHMISSDVHLMSADFQHVS